MKYAKIGITAPEMLAMARPEAEISAEQLAKLEQLVEAFPWFSCGQLLLLKAMKQRRHPSFSAQLLSTSLYATSRERLQDYLRRVKVAGAQGQDFPAASPSEDGFEVMPADTVCEKEVETPPEPAALGRQGAAAYHDQLIDIFLAAPPPAITLRPDVSESNLAQPAGEEDAEHEMVSETLAEIYLAQGLPDKAAKIYSKLSLLYPEKKAYFAARFQSRRA